MKTFKIVVEVKLKEGDAGFILDAIQENLERGEDILNYEIEELNAWNTIYFLILKMSYW